MSDHDNEVALLREIGVLSDQVRALRRSEGKHDGTQIKALEGQSRIKWDELRLVRAGTVVVDSSSPRRRGLYI